jgi:YgiT-type zinc finger domain-containing protein
MSQKDPLEEWQSLSQEVLVGLREWRAQHPQASLREIEAELDQRLARLRARLLQDSVLQSQARDWQEAPAGQQPLCPECGQVLEAKGSQRRELQTHGQQAVVLERQYGVCPKCGMGFFPPG